VVIDAKPSRHTEDKFHLVTTKTKGANGVAISSSFVASLSKTHVSVFRYRTWQSIYKLLPLLPKLGIYWFLVLKVHAFPGILVAD
jgi:hypothetical protein